MAYNPITNPKRAKERQQHIIDRMEVNGFIDATQQEAAKAQVLRYRRPSEFPAHAEHVAEVARQMIFGQYGDDAYTRGLNVYLTLNSADQNVAYRALRKGIMDYERRQVYRGPEAYADLPSNSRELDARVAEVLQEHPDNDELKSAVVLEASPKKVVAMLQSGESVTIVGEGLKPTASGLLDKASPKLRVRRGAVIRVTPSGKGEWTITQLPEVEGAFIAMDPRTGAIRSMVGGFDFAKSKFNHVTQAWRQPGSSFKPFIYSAALEQGFTPATVVNDGPLFFDADATGSQPWEPKNFDGGFDGPMSQRRGLAKSKNMISIRILQAIGPAYARSWVTRFGFEAERHPAYLTMALGAGSVTPMQMVGAYAVFANGGHRIHPMLIGKITDTKGRVLSEAVPGVLDEASRTLSARNAFVMSSLLQASRLDRMVEQVALDGPIAYPPLEFLTDLRKGTWVELSTPGTAITIYRRNLQRSYLSNIDSRLNGATAPSDEVRALLRGELRTLKSEIAAALPSVTDEMSKRHFTDTQDQIDMILDPRAMRERAGAAGAGGGRGGGAR